MSMIASTAGTQLVQHGRCMFPVSRLWRTSRPLSPFRTPQRYVSTGSQPRDDLPDVQRLAELSQIEVTPQEAEEWGPKIAEIVDWFGQLQSVNTESVEPALRAAIKNKSNMLRPDTVQEFEQRDSLMKEMPEMEGPYVKVPKVF